MKQITNKLKNNNKNTMKHITTNEKQNNKYEEQKQQKNMNTITKKIEKHNTKILKT